MKKKRSICPVNLVSRWDLRMYVNRTRSIKVLLVSPVRGENALHPRVTRPV